MSGNLRKTSNQMILTTIERLEECAKLPDTLKRVGYSGILQDLRDWVNEARVVTDDGEPVTRLWFIEKKCKPGRFAVHVREKIVLLVVSSGGVRLQAAETIYELNEVKTRGDLRTLLKLLSGNPAESPDEPSI